MNSLDKLEDYDRLAKENADLRAQLAAANKRLEDAEKQEPVGEVAPSSDGSGIIGVKWSGENTRKLMFGDKLYTSQIPPADVAELNERIAYLESYIEGQNDSFAQMMEGKEKLERTTRDDAQTILILVRQLRYCIGIAERGMSKVCPDEEIGELYLLNYVKGLERKLAEQHARILQLLESLGTANAEYYTYNPIRGQEELDNLLAKAKEESTCHPAACRDEMLWRAELAKAKEEGRREAIKK